MAAKYPGAIPSLNEIFLVTDYVDWVKNEVWNDMRTELRAALVELGTDPKGGFGDVKARLEALALKSNVLELDNAVPFTPDNDHEPATKKYVDDIGGVGFQSKCKGYIADDDQTIQHNTWTKIELDTEDFDPLNEFDPDTLYRFTAGVSGYYLAIGKVLYLTPVADKFFSTAIYKNGLAYVAVYYHTSHVGNVSPLVSDIVYLAANDYLELFTYHQAGVAELTYHGISHVFMSIHRLS